MMSENNERKRRLTCLRVRKHRAIVREISNERHSSDDVQDANTADDDRNQCITPDRETAGDSVYQMDGTGDENEQSLEYSCRGGTSDSDDDNHIERPTVSDNDDIIDGGSSADACSNRSHNYDSEVVDEYHDNEVVEIRNWAIQANLPFIHLDSLLRILRRRLIPELPQSSKTFLQTSAAEYNIIEMADGNGENGQFVYIGIAAGLHKCVNAKLHKTNSTLQLQFNIDGMQIGNSSFSQVWPILCKIFYSPDIYKPFPVAMYCGASKPKSMNTYLGQFVEEMNDLSQRNIVIDGKVFQVSIQSFICDTPARAMLKSVKGHTGFHACERCNVEGIKSNWTTVFPSIDSEQRTDETFRNKDHPEHHNFEPSILLLLEPPIDMVKQFILDSMHLTSGVMKKLITYWVSGRLHFRLSCSDKSKLSARLVYLKKSIPTEFQRKPRAIQYIAKWKATELRFFLLYCGPIVLRGILNERLYKHFLLLHVASRILFSSELALDRNRYAKIYLKSFFLALKEYYGPESQVINSHNLIHIADDAVNMQCELSQISAFPFENTLGTVIKKFIRTQNRPLLESCGIKLGLNE